MHQLYTQIRNKYLINNQSITHMPHGYWTLFLETEEMGVFISTVACRRNCSWWGSIKNDLQLPPLTRLCFARSILCLTKAKVLLLSWTHSSPSQQKLFPWVPCLSEVKNLQQLLAFIQQKRAKENAHIMELKKYHLQLQQVCVCVSIWLHVCIVHKCMWTVLTR